jgi:hypothetical protein
LYIWRIPLVFAAELVVVASLLAVTTTLLWARRSFRNPVSKAIASAAIFVAFALSPLAVDRLALYRHNQEGLHSIYIDPSPFDELTPAAFDAVVLVASFRVFRGIPSSGSLRYRFSFYVAVVTLFALNVINSCSPGWCERFGFPFPYSSWSDAIVYFNDSTPSPWSPIGAAFDLVAVSAATVAFARYVRKRSFDKTTA